MKVIRFALCAVLYAAVLLAGAQTSAQELVVPQKGIEAINLLVAEWRASGKEARNVDPIPNAVTSDGTDAVQYFNDGYLIALWAPVYGAHFVYGAIRDLYWNTGMMKNFGYPVADEVDAPPDSPCGKATGFPAVRQQEFSATMLFCWSPDIGAWHVNLTVRLPSPILNPIDVPEPQPDPNKKQYFWYNLTCSCVGYNPTEGIVHMGSTLWAHQCIGAQPQADVSVWADDACRQACKAIHGSGVEGLGGLVPSAISSTGNACKFPGDVQKGHLSLAPK